MKLSDLLANGRKAIGRRLSASVPSHTPNKKTSSFDATVGDSSGDLVIDEDQLARIEQLVFQRLGQGINEREQSIRSLESIDDHISNAELAEMVFGDDGDEPSLGFDLGRNELIGATEPKEQRSARLRFRYLVLGGMVVVLLASSVVRFPATWTAGNSFPLKYQIESIRLALSIGDEAKAESLMSIAGDRLAFMVKAGRSDEDVLVAGMQMNSAASAALDILYRLPAGPARDSAAGRLFGLMTSAISHLKGIESIVEQKLRPQVAGIIGSSTMIALEARILLAYFDLGGTSPEEMRRFVRANSERFAKQLRNTGPSAPLEVASPSDEESPSGPTDQPPGNDVPETGCDVSQGSICITVPPLPTL